MAILLNWQYLAGFIDADGSFLSGNFRKRVVIYNTDFQVLQHIKEFLNGGSISKRKHYAGHLGNKTIFVYQYVKATKKKPHNANAIANCLAPFIVLKKKQFERVFDIPAKGVNISWSYLAGFFDGDGSLVFYPKEGSSHWYLLIVNRNKEILERIKDFLVCGNIHRHGNCFMFKIGKRDDVCRIGRNTLEFSIVKRQKIEAMLNFYANDEWHPNYKMKHVTKEELAELYLDDGFSIRQLAKIYGVKYNPMRERLIKFGVPLRPLGTNQHSTLGGLNA